LHPPAKLDACRYRAKRGGAPLAANMMGNGLCDKSFDALTRSFSKKRGAHSTEQIALLMFGQHHRLPHFTKPLMLGPFKRAMPNDPPVEGDGYDRNQFATLILLKKALGIVGLVMKVAWAVDAQGEIRHAVGVGTGQPPNGVVV
jgi:hypothetical protein